MVHFGSCIHPFFCMWVVLSIQPWNNSGRVAPLLTCFLPSSGYRPILEAMKTFAVDSDIAWIDIEVCLE